MFRAMAHLARIKLKTWSFLIYGFNSGKIFDTGLPLIGSFETMGERNALLKCQEGIFAFIFCAAVRRRVQIQ